MRRKNRKYSNAKKGERSDDDDDYDIHIYFSFDQQSDLIIVIDAFIDSDRF